jgi:hypothetical protein
MCGHHSGSGRHLSQAGNKGWERKFHDRCGRVSPGRVLDEHGARSVVDGLSILAIAETLVGR